MRRVLLVLILLALKGIATPALSDERIALVIGNANYKRWGQLATPRNDADAVEEALRGIGFQSVQLEHDLSREAFMRALRSFARKADNAEWAVIYFSGYGVAIDDNYLVPVDTELNRVRDVDFEAVPLNLLIYTAGRAKKLGLVLLDASRGLRGMSTCIRCLRQRGLLSVEPEAGTLVSFSAKHGEPSVDDDGKNSPYVTALLKHITTPGLDVPVLFGNVRDDVLAATGGRQEPFLYGAVAKQPLYFVDPK
jgi:uncharacterized caspase-like protein